MDSMMNLKNKFFLYISTLETSISYVKEKYQFLNKFKNSFLTYIFPLVLNIRNSLIFKYIEILMYLVYNILKIY
jgi:hypothetical protein